MILENFTNRMIKKKHVDAEPSKLKRCLTTLDLIGLGIGSTLGLGVYVLAGKVARSDTGPSIIIAFLVAAVASVFAGLCYAEFGSRVPKAGSAYVYSYVTVGELVAFIIGWNLILEYVIGIASVARGYSGYLDALVDNRMTESFRNAMPMNVSFLGDYPDFFALGMVLVLTALLSIGVKESSRFNNIFTGLNLLIILYVIICGLFKADVNNWKIKESEIPYGIDGGHGGFMPFGFGAMMRGAATCFFGFVGFDCIATTGEEVNNPQVAIPIAIAVSLLFIFLSYFGIAAVITLMIPYYDQDINAPIPHAFLQVGYPVARWVVSIGALAGLSTALLGATFPLPRVIYAMAKDGLLFRFLSRIHPRFQTPFIATIVSGVLAALMACLFDLDSLVDMMSIGTLLAYMLVACSVLIVRYRIPLKEGSDPSNPHNHLQSSTNYNMVSVPLWAQILGRGPERATGKDNPMMVGLLGLLFLLLAALAAVLVFCEDRLYSGNPAVVAVSCVLLGLCVVQMIIISFHPENQTKVAFKVPFVPYVPGLSIFINLYLMFKLTHQTWIRFGVWLAIGLVIYFLYGQFESNERYLEQGKVPPSLNDDQPDSTSQTKTSEVVTEAGGSISGNEVLQKPETEELPITYILPPEEEAPRPPINLNKLARKA